MIQHKEVLHYQVRMTTAEREDVGGESVGTRSISAVYALLTLDRDYSNHHRCYCDHRSYYRCGYWPKGQARVIILLTQTKQLKPRWLVRNINTNFCARNIS